MAPRRGGGGSGFSIDTPSCSSDAFENEAARVYISFDALYFIVSVALFIIMTKRSSHSKRQGHLLAGRVPLRLSIIFAILAYIANIIIRVVSQCLYGGGIYDELFQSELVPIWLSSLSEYILNVVIMITICKKLQHDFAPLLKLIVLFQSLYIGIVGVVLVASLAIDTATRRAAVPEDYDYALIEKLRDPGRGLWTTYTTLSLFGIIIACLTMIRATASAPQNLRTKASQPFLTAWVGVLAICALAFNATVLGGYTNGAFVDPYSITRSKAEYLEKSAEAVYFLAAFFYSVTFYAALQVLRYIQAAVTQSTAVPVAEPYYHAQVAAPQSNPVPAAGPYY
ncbi:hypothetical protein BJX61DRAFT_546169 [Aspergillus egyptiacus]|nr:hypothetical protein BJX61DRAFT_546169 [Aspergillus egyptiacus]